MTVQFQDLILSSPALRRAFLLVLLVHLVLLALVLAGIKYWEQPRGVPVPAGIALEMAEPSPGQRPTDEPPVLDRALEEIPPEARAMPLPDAPEVRSLMIPEPAVRFPDPVEVGGPVMPEMGRIAGRERVGVPFVKASDSAADVDAPGGRPVALSGIMPKYPYGARARGEAGQVTVAVRVNGKGAVESAVVVSSSGYPALDESAVAATKKARFKPAEKEGQPVPSNMNLKFEFRLEER